VLLKDRTCMIKGWSEREAGGNHQTKVPVKGIQTYSTCDCLPVFKVTQSATLSDYATEYSWCETYEIPKCITYFSIENVPAYWERRLCFPLNRQHLFKGKCFVSCHLAWWDGNESREIVLVGEKRMWAPFALPQPGCPLITSMLRGPWFCEDSSMSE